MTLLRIFLTGLVIVVSPVISLSQHWTSLLNGFNWPAPNVFYTDTIDNALYLGGGFSFAYQDTVRCIAKWDGSNFYGLGCGINYYCNSLPTCALNPVEAIIRYNNKLVVGGAIYSAGGKPIKNIAQWDGVQWDSVGLGVNGALLGLRVFNNELYAFGTFDSAGSIKANSLAKWNGLQWSSVYNLPRIYGINMVYDIEMYKGNLYVGGNFDNDTLSDLIMYNGSAWVKVGETFKGGMSCIMKLIVYKDELYVAGAFYKVDGNVGNFIQRWDGVQWKEVGGGVYGANMSPYSNGQIWDLKVYNNELYVCGDFEYAGGIPIKYLAKWDGLKWCGFGSNFDSPVYSLGFYKDSLYVGCCFTIDGDTVHSIAKWTGGDYVDTCGTLGNSLLLEDISSPKLSVFPNPATDKINLTFNTEHSENIKVTVYNITGAIELSEYYKHLQGNTTKQLNISKLTNGIYLLRIESGKAVHYGKIIKQK